MGDFHELPPDLPVPPEDGAAANLVGSSVPTVRLAASTGGELNLSEATRQLTVIYVYPRTGRPGEPLPEGWGRIPGARGCTPQSCGFRDHAAALRRLGSAVIGLSAQSADEQLEFAAREHIPYPLLSDPTLRLAELLELPTFTAAGMRLYKRLTLIARSRQIEKVFYPVFPPDRNAAEVVEWLSSLRATGPQ